MHQFARLDARRESRVRGDRQVGNLDFDARVPIPVSVFPSTYRSDATSVETTSETRVEGSVNQGAATQRVGREDTRLRTEETVHVKTSGYRPNTEERPNEDFRVVEETRVQSDRYPNQFSERQYTGQQFEDQVQYRDQSQYRDQTNRFAEVDLTRERYQDSAPADYRTNKQVTFDVTDSREPRGYSYERATVNVQDRPSYETQIDITERDYRRRTQPNYAVEYERTRPTVNEDIVVEKKTEKVVEKTPERKMGYYDDQGEYHSFRRGVQRAADNIFHPFSRHDHDTNVEKDRASTRITTNVTENVRIVEPRHPAGRNTVTIPCHFIRIGDLLTLQGRPCQVIRISQSGQTGQYRYLGVDLFTRQLHEESSFSSNPEPSVYVQSMTGPVFKQYRILDMTSGGDVVCMTETGDVKQGLPIVDQGGLYAKIGKAFDDGRGSVRALVINDGGRELIVDYKVIHGSRL